MHENHNLLLLEKDINISPQLKRFLKKAGFEIDIFYAFKNAEQNIVFNKYQLILSSMSFFEVNIDYFFNIIQMDTDTPILLLADMNQKHSLLSALQKGISDFILQPIQFEELLIRIQILLHKNKKIPKYNELLTFRSFLLDLNKHKLFLLNEEKQKTEILLTPIEFSILKLFVTYPNTLLTYDDLYHTIWKSDCLDDVRTVMVHISNLRKKIDCSQKGIITTVRRAGYIFSDV